MALQLLLIITAGSVRLRVGTGRTISQLTVREGSQAEMTVVSRVRRVECRERSEQAIKRSKRSFEMDEGKSVVL